VDQTAVLLRFYQGMEFEQLAAAMRVTEVAARKRVTRAVGRLRNMLGGGVTAESLMGAAGARSMPMDLAHAVARGAVGKSAGANATASAKGASYLMTLAKVKAVAVAVAACVGLVVGARLLPQFVRAQSPVAAQPTPTKPSETQIAASDDLAEFNRIYSLKGDEVLIRIPPPFSPARLAFYKKMVPWQAKSIPKGPDWMTLKYGELPGATRPGKTVHIWAMGFGAPLTLGGVADSVTRIFPQELEGDKDLLLEQIPGDFVYAPGADEKLYLQGLKKIMEDQLGTPVNFAFRQVDRSVMVLKGNWKFSPVDAKARQDRVVEFYGGRVNNDRSRGGGGTGSSADFGGALGGAIGQQVIIEAERFPREVSWRYNDEDWMAAGADHQDTDLLIKHISEQTGLTCTVETRKVRRLFVEHGNGQEGL
jgi:hypothetical protein